MPGNTNTESSLPRIGRCMRCQSTKRIDKGVCGSCLPKVSLKFAELALRAQTDRAFAKVIHGRLESAELRERFVRGLGYDPGAE